MQKLKLVTFLILLWQQNVMQTQADATDAKQNTHYDEDELILQKCLTEKGGKDLQKITNFASWNDSEEVPCFTRCLSDAKGWYNATEENWNRQNIVADLGEDLWNYCKYELERTHFNECEHVHQGFRCLKKAEENTPQTYMTLLNCAIELGADLKALHAYGNLTEPEPIPCLFKCFADKTDLYDADLKWNFINWTTAFGPFDIEKATVTCREEEKTEDNCAWMYREFLCLEQLDNSGGVAEKATTITLEATEVTKSESTIEDIDSQNINSSTAADTRELTSSNIELEVKGEAATTSSTIATSTEESDNATAI